MGAIDDDLKNIISVLLYAATWRRSSKILFSCTYRNSYYVLYVCTLPRWNLTSLGPWKMKMKSKFGILLLFNIVRIFVNINTWQGLLFAKRWRVSICALYHYTYFLFAQRSMNAVTTVQDWDSFEYMWTETAVYLPLYSCLRSEEYAAKLGLAGSVAYQSLKLQACSAHSSAPHYSRAQTAVSSTIFWWTLGDFSEPRKGKYCYWYIRCW